MNGNPMKNKLTVRPVSTVAFMMTATIIAKALGMLRGMQIASRYGTGMAAEAFNTALQIPLNLFDFAFGAAILGCFIPVYNSFKQEDRAADEFAHVFMNLVILATAMLALIGILFADSIIALITPGLGSDTKKLAAQLLRIMFPMIVLIGNTYLFVGVLQSRGRYLLPAAVSAVSNAGVIVYLLFFDPLLGKNSIYGLAAAYVISWLIQLLTLAIPLFTSGFKFFYSLSSVKQSVLNAGPALKRAIKMTPPIIIGAWLAPAGLLSGVYFASSVKLNGVGSVTVFSSAYYIYLIIAGTLTYSICNYAFPLLSRLGNENGVMWRKVVRSGITSSAAIIIPSAIAVYILAGEGVAVLYMRGEFGVQAARETADTLRFMSFGMPAFAFIEIINRVFYSKSMVYVPMIAAICGVVLNISASALFIHIEPLRVGAVGLGYAVGQTAAAAVLAVFLFRKTNVINKVLVIMLLKLTAASLLSGTAMIMMYKLIGNDLYTAGVVHNVINSFIVVSAGAVIYFTAIKLTGVRLSSGSPDKTK